MVRERNERAATIVRINPANDQGSFDKSVDMSGQRRRRETGCMREFGHPLARLGQQRSEDLPVFEGQVLGLERRLQLTPQHAFGLLELQRHRVHGTSSSRRSCISVSAV